MRSRSEGISRFFVILLLLFLLPPRTAAAVSIPAQPPDYVVDLAHVINDRQEKELDRYLRELEEKTTAQFIVLTVSDLGGDSIEDFSITLAHDRWKLGQKGKDNGLLLVVAVRNRKYRIEVGYGLEGLLPDSRVGTIGRRYLVPAFRRGDYSGGITNAALALAGIIASNAGVTITGMPEPPRPRPVRRRPTVFGSIGSIIFFIFMAILFIRNPRLFFLLFLMSGMGGGRRGPWDGGGFGGGGGGGFGGGGASGSW
ncbi:MAG: TPM domain-containing protein [Deltaproteobacteria bacterium]|nr:TPM domain-containing protein [Deltaproteobacteria bacterium]